MGLYVDTTGFPYAGIGICDRCRRKFPISELRPDGNTPGLRVCADDWDGLDPYRLPARPPDNINLPFVRPDVDLAVKQPVPTRFILATEDELGISTEDGEGLEVL